MLNLTSAEVERYLLSIFSRKKYNYIDKGSKKEYVVFVHPTSDIKLKADFLYESAYQDAVASGLLPLAQLEELIESKKLFSEEDNKELQQLNAKIKAQQVYLSKIKNVLANADKVKNHIKELQDKVDQLNYKKYSKLAMSAESKANEERIFYLCWACVYSFENDLFWKTYSDFLNESNYTFRNTVLNSFDTFLRGIDVTTIRFIARSSIWRARYINSIKGLENLFGVPVAEYSVDQLSLAYWSNYYQNIYEMLPEDRPNDSIIEDDLELDTYMEELYKKREAEHANKNFNNRVKKGKLSAFNAEEVIVTRSHEMYQEIKYDKPKEAQKLKETTDIKKRAINRSGRRR